MEKNSYGKILRELLDFSNVKFLVLANHLGYDVSYISKWCNGSKTPAAKSIEEINQNISTLLSEEIMRIRKEEKFLKKFKKEIQTTSITLPLLKSVILELLEKNYNNCYEEKECEDSIFTDKEDIRKKLSASIIEALSETNEQIDIHLCLDLSSKECLYILSKIVQYKSKELKVLVHTAIDMKKISDITYTKKIYSILNKFTEIDIELYNLEEIPHLNILLFGRKIGFLYSADKDQRIKILIENKNKNNLEKMKNVLFNSVTIKENVIKSIDIETLLKKAYRTNFYMGNSFNFLVSTGFEFFLPKNILENILLYAENNNYRKEDMELIQKLTIAWEEIFEKANINFFILKSALTKYLQEKKIYLGNIEYTMSLEEVKDHYNHFIKLMKKNPNINIYILDDSKNEYISEFVISIFCNGEKIYFKNLKKIQNKEEPSVSIVTNKELISKINQNFQELVNLDICKNYTLEDIESFWDKYKNIIFRFIQLDTLSIS